MDPKLRPEVALSKECWEVVGQAIVRLLQGHDTETPNIIRPLKLACRVYSKRGRSYARHAQFFYDVGKDILDRPQRGSGEV
jgi:hypothetical protein